MKIFNSIAITVALVSTGLFANPSFSEDLDSLWSIVQTNQVNLDESFLINLNSIRRPGDGDDFWHVQAKDQSGIITTYSFDCYTGSYFPNGEAPSKPVKKQTLEDSLMSYACAPPSQIENLKESLTR
ncbi:hypothetical protein SynBIOSU31_01283 [Synechococcus sp. BIOS-U3-1]|nr:hypothetical protein SynBIOSU31_01283 [Synechococcus sp. BIOS-U3-1]